MVEFVRPILQTAQELARATARKIHPLIVRSFFPLVYTYLYIFFVTFGMKLV